jgi:hypothetical protein
VSGEKTPTMREIAERTAMTAGVEFMVSQAAGAPFNPASVVAALGEGLLERRWNMTEEFIGAIAAEVGDDVLLATLERDSERDALMWTALDAAVRSGLEQKRIVLAKVVANAMTSDEHVEEAHLIVGALQVLDAPHIRALVHLRDADDANQTNPGTAGDDLPGCGVRTRTYACLGRPGTRRGGVSGFRAAGEWSLQHSESENVWHY